LTTALNLDSTTFVVDATNNRVGIGTSAPQVALSVVGGVNVDESNVNNGGLPSSLRFGSFSGEGISSNRVGGANHIGLDLWTNATKRLSITNDGKIGIGTATPTARLHMPATGSGQAIEFPGLRVFENSMSPNVVGGHADNSLVGTVFGVTIGGGGTAGDVGSNASASDYATIGGGVGNKVDVFSTYGTVGGGLSNSVINHFGTIAGGVENVVWETHGFIGGGANNAAKHKSAIAGGEFNATEQLGFVGAGYSNSAGSYGVAAGGFDNTSGGYSTSIGGGSLNQATGDYSTVPGGSGNVSLGQYSLAGGRNAHANHNGAFVWSDSTAPGTPFASTGANQFLILANGGVGINTNAPTSSLQVNGGIRARGGSPGGAGANNNGFAFAGNGGDNDSGMFSSADGQLEFYSNANELIRITPSGNVGIGTTNPTSKFEVNGSAAKPGGGLWSVSSDARLKKNVAPLEHSLEDLLSLHGVTYEYIDPAAINELEGTRIGFIAQNVEEVFPDWVDFGPNGFRRLTIRGFEAVAVEAIRELRDEKESQIRTLQSELDATRQRLAELESVVRELADLAKAHSTTGDQR
ncbi:MAG: tail fiber domain-containing protein, partial [Phycisphaerae bacterium]|nr:tail fiber domain-containing protein [Phycisphaerae bacterium]